MLLPELADDGLVKFDKSEDEVARGARFDELRPLLEHVDKYR